MLLMRIVCILIFKQISFIFTEIKERLCRVDLLFVIFTRINSYTYNEKKQYNALEVEEDSDDKEEGCDQQEEEKMEKRKNTKNKEETVEKEKNEEETIEELENNTNEGKTLEKKKNIN